MATNTPEPTPADTSVLVRGLWTPPGKRPERQGGDHVFTPPQVPMFRGTWQLHTHWWSWNSSRSHRPPLS